MGYDHRAVKVKKTEKIMAIMTFNRERERNYIREIVRATERNNRSRSARNKGEKDE